MTILREAFMMLFQDPFVCMCAEAVPLVLSPASLLLQILQVLVEESLARSSACTNWNLFFWFSGNHHNIWGSKPIIFIYCPYLKQMNIGKSELLWGSPGDSMGFDPYSGAAG